MLQTIFYVFIYQHRIFMLNIIFLLNFKATIAKTSFFRNYCSFFLIIQHLYKTVRNQTWLITISKKMQGKNIQNDFF